MEFTDGTSYTMTFIAYNYHKNKRMQLLKKKVVHFSIILATLFCHIHLTVFSYFQEKEEICSGKVIIAH
jgi:hypothetical protein